MPLDLLDEPSWRTSQLVSPVLAGVALATSVLSGWWAARARHTLVLAGWLVLGAASVVGHWLLPSVLGGSSARPIESQAVEQLERMAYGLEGLREAAWRRSASPRLPAVPSLWNPSVCRPGTCGRLGTPRLSGSRGTDPPGQAPAGLAGRALRLQPSA